MSNVKALMSAAIGTLKLFGAKVGAPLFPITVSIFAPVLAEPPSTFTCQVEVFPLDSSARAIYGEGSLQALCLAARHAIQLLATFVEQGGQLSYANGESFDLGSYGFRLLGDS